MKIPDAKAAVDKEWEKLEKLPARQLTKVKSKKKSYPGSTVRGKNSPFCYADGHLSSRKNAELEPKYQKYKGRVVLQGDFVKDDSGSYAVFIEQGSSASHMTAAKVIDVIARLPVCAGQAADAVSASTQVKMEDAQS